MQLRTLVLKACVGLTLLSLSGVALAQYKLTNLVSNQVKGARRLDPFVVNAWGLAYGPGSPLWVADAGSGWSTLYDSFGNAKSLKVEIASAGDAGPGQPTGIVFNASQDFQVKGWASVFIFATLDGTISGWAPQSDLHNSIIAVDTSKDTHPAVYTALAVTSKTTGNRLFAADVANGKVDMFDGTFALKGSFTDPNVPTGFVPFGIQDIHGQVYVAFADAAGGKGGVIDIFSEDGVFVKRLAEGGPLNQPWGMTIAPPNFGPLSNTLLVSNNTNTGTINAFNAVSGALVGTMKDTNGKPIVIDQLWAIVFGGGVANDGRTNQLFFTAGPVNNLTGTLGSISF
jgi:uncharacterized protein (TIGR03118 family)